MEARLLPETAPSQDSLIAEFEPPEEEEDLEHPEFARKSPEADSSCCCCFRRDSIERLLRKCWPGMFRWLRALGYEQALVIKGWTHTALWFSSMISFAFSAFWFADVCRGNCVKVSASLLDPRSWFQCIWEAFGLCIFFVSFCDSVRMIAHYDDDRQQVLAQKWDVLKRLNIESQAALRDARKNVEGLRKKVTAALEEQLVNYIANAFGIILPGLETSAVAQEEGFESRRKRPDLPSSHELFTPILPRNEARVAELLRDNLKEVGDVSDEMFKVLARNHEEVYKSATKASDDSFSGSDHLRLWDRWIEVEFPRFKPVTQDGQHFGGAIRRVARGSDVESSKKELDSFQSESQPVLSEADIQLLLSKPGRTNSEKLQLAQCVARDVLAPVKDILRIPDNFARKKNQVVKKSNTNRQKERQRAGWGCPPANAAVVLEDEPTPWRRCCGFSCCVPRLVACFVCNCCCCPRRFCGGQNPSKVCQKLIGYEPAKHFSFGCFWVQLFTKLQERLIQGLFFSVTYWASFVFLLWRSFAQDPVFDSDCNGASESVTVMRTCTIKLVQRFIGVAAMSVYIPSLIFCLVNVRRLDEVMETIETIQELQDIQQAVHSFSAHMDNEKGSISLLKALNERVLCRMQLVDKFDKLFARYLDKADLVSHIASDLCVYLENVVQELQPASEWFLLSEHEQAVCSQKAALQIEEAVKKNSLRRATDPHETLLYRDRMSATSRSSTDPDAELGLGAGKSRPPEFGPSAKEASRSGTPSVATSSSVEGKPAMPTGTFTLDDSPTTTPKTSFNAAELERTSQAPLMPVGTQQFR